MPKESLKSKQSRALIISERLNEIYPNPDTELIYDGDAFHLVIAVMLSAQTTDKAVNKVTPLIWKKYPTIDQLAEAQIEDIEDIIRTIGFYHNKAKNVIGCARMVRDDFNGKVPADMNLLQKLPGVGRKTANVISNTAFDIVEGIAVDTHVFRISHLLKLSNAKTPLETELDLLKVFPRELWKPINHQLVLYGRQVCIARRPKCTECVLNDICPSSNVSL